MKKKCAFSTKIYGALRPVSVQARGRVSQALKSRSHPPGLVKSGLFPLAFGEFGPDLAGCALRILPTRQVQLRYCTAISTTRCAHSHKAQGKLQSGCITPRQVRSARARSRRISLSTEGPMPRSSRSTSPSWAHQREGTHRR